MSMLIGALTLTAMLASGPIPSVGPEKVEGLIQFPAGFIDNCLDVGYFVAKRKVKSTGKMVYLTFNCELLFESEHSPHRDKKAMERAFE